MSPRKHYSGLPEINGKLICILQRRRQLTKMNIQSFLKNSIFLLKIGGKDLTFFFPFHVTIDSSIFKILSLITYCRCCLFCCAIFQNLAKKASLKDQSLSSCTECPGSPALCLLQPGNHPRLQASSHPSGRT